MRAVTRDLRKAEANRLPHVQFVQSDFDDPESMRTACAGVDRAFLLTNSTERAEQQQVAFTRVAQQSGVRHIVKLSQLHADASSPGRFLRYHGLVEAAIQASGLTLTFLRPNLYMQGLLNFRQSIRQKRAFFAAAGDARISAVDVRDLAAVAALTTSQHDNKIYSLTGSDRGLGSDVVTRFDPFLVVARPHAPRCHARLVGIRFHTKSFHFRTYGCHRDL